MKSWDATQPNPVMQRIGLHPTDDHPARLTRMKNPTGQSSTEFVILPEVMLAWIYLLCVHIWTIWQMCTLKFPTSDADPIRFMTGGQYALLTSLNAAFFLAFVLGGIRARRSSPSLRKGHIISVLAGAAIMIAMQIASHRLYGPIELL
jgi:hypothetical protein